MSGRTSPALYRIVREKFPNISSADLFTDSCVLARTCCLTSYRHQRYHLCQIFSQQVPGWELNAHRPATSPCNRPTQRVTTHCMEAELSSPRLETTRPSMNKMTVRRRIRRNNDSRGTWRRRAALNDSATDVPITNTNLHRHDSAMDMPMTNTKLPGHDSASQTQTYTKIHGHDSAMNVPMTNTKIQGHDSALDVSMTNTNLHGHDSAVSSFISDN